VPPPFAFIEAGSQYRNPGDAGRLQLHLRKLRHRPPSPRLYPKAAPYEANGSIHPSERFSSRRLTKQGQNGLWTCQPAPRYWRGQADGLVLVYHFSVFADPDSEKNLPTYLEDYSTILDSIWVLPDRTRRSLNDAESTCGRNRGWLRAYPCVRFFARTPLSDRLLGRPPQDAVE